MESVKKTNILIKLTSIPLTLITFSFLSLTPAQAAPLWVQTHKILASDGERSDWFGISAAADGNLALIGAWFDDDNGNGSGSAYIYDKITNQQLFKLLASDGADADGFGISVAISGNLAVIGADGDDVNGVMSTGSAYVFDVTTGKQLFKLLASDREKLDLFGNSVAISGNLAVIGALFDDDNGFSSGSAYVFDVTTGKQLFKLLPSDGVKYDEFGASVAISGNLAVVGAKYDADNGLYSGSAYVFNVKTGKQLFKLLPSDGSEGDRFGTSVAINNNLALIGADGDGNAIGSGSVYIFDITTGKQLFEMLPSDGELGDKFGASVATSDNLVVIGASSDDDNGLISGSAYVFDITTGQQLFKLLPSDGSYNNRFGASVAVSGNLAVVGAYLNDGKGYESGSAYVFETLTSNYLTVEPFPLLPGHRGVFSLVGGLPNEISWLLYSVDGLGKTIIPQLNIIIDLSNPKIAIGPGLTDENGDRQIIRQIPAVTEPTDVWFQAVQQNNMTNFFQTKILP